MSTPHAARFQAPLERGAVRCTLCPHECRIRDGGRGACGVRYVDAGRLYTVAYDAVVARRAEPIEKKPLFHYRPGTLAYSVSTVGCNLRCAYCQNWGTSQWPRRSLPARLGAGGVAALTRRVPGERVTPRDLVDAARASGCASIAYTFTEPTVFCELVVDTAALARAAGLGNVLVTNGFTSEEAVRALAAVVDAANVDLKFIDPESYRRVCKARLEPVLAAIRLYRALGVWVEVTTLVVPGLNDSDEELHGIACFLRSVGPEVPWHVSRFQPAHELLDCPPTPVATLRRAAEIGRAAGLRHVYLGNVPGEAEESTYCAECGELLIERFGFGVVRQQLRDGRCPGCGTPLDGVGVAGGSVPAAPGLQLGLA